MSELAGSVPAFEKELHTRLERWAAVRERMGRARIDMVSAGNLTEVFAGRRLLITGRLIGDTVGLVTDEDSRSKRSPRYVEDLIVERAEIFATDRADVPEAELPCLHLNAYIAGTEDQVTAFVASSGVRIELVPEQTEA